MSRTATGISLCMIVRNEAANLARCLESIHKAVDQMIIVDTGSTDDTVQIAHRFGAQVLHVPWDGDFAKARNAGIELARNAWILFMDADEELETGDIAELRLCAQHLEFEGFFLQVHNHVSNDIRSTTATVNPLLRMFRRRPEHRFRGRIHEQIAASIIEHRPAAKLHITNIKIHHYGYSSGMVASKNKIRRNMELLQLALEAEPEEPFHHYNMAVEYMRLNEHEPALHHIHQAKDLAAPEISYYHLLFKYESRCLFALGRAEEAIAACSSGLVQYPDYTDLYHLKGVISLAAGQLIEAEQAFLRAIEAGPAPMHYHTENGAGTYLSTLGLGQMNEDAGDDEQAIRWYAETIKHEPGMRIPLNKIIMLMKTNLQERLLPSFMHDHFKINTAKQKNIIINLLKANRCYHAAYMLLKNVQLDASRENENEAEHILYNELFETTKLQKPGTFDESSTLNPLKQIELTYDSGKTEDALNSLHALLSTLPAASATPPSDPIASVSRVLTAFAEARLLQELKDQPYQSIIRRALRMLPMYEEYE
ncbi:glycosyltransferase [Paenibacillus sp. HJL G12]|uniref:Glycosyltransferase n=1 Tax=Paenibacillus dendrobii TaxID=2691084 RepID=A0A7X3LGL8_9BACL|nr:glycosyltransferase family 2 protein [Paenibacillus dendrobii]MWV42304.1 glycosyltransferase [Paenibacillus dendrobii]